MPRPPAAMPALMLMTLDDVKQLSFLNTSKAFSHWPDSSQALIHQLYFHVLPLSQPDGGFIA